MFHGVGDGYLDVFLDVATTVARCTNKQVVFRCNVFLFSGVASLFGQDE